MLCMKHVRSPVFPFLGHSGGVPLVVMGDGGEQRDRKWVEVKLF